MEDVTFTDHCRLQMTERKIGKKPVMDCLKNPDKLILQYGKRFRIVKKVRRFKKLYLIVVVFDQLPKFKEIVTVFYTSKFKKYL